MATEEQTVVLVCDNSFHRGLGDGPVFSMDAGRGVAVSERVPIEVAAQLVEEVDGYRCPQLDAVEQAEAGADPEDGPVGSSSSKLDGAPMPEGSAGASQQEATQEREEQARGDDAEEEPEAHEEPEASQAEALARMEALDGVGPGYARKLVAAGIETRGALAAAVPGELAERSGIPEGRIENWQERL